MRTARQIPWYLIASILISLSALALANLLAEPLKEEGSYLALTMVILIPGYLAVLFLFPAGGDLDLSRRLLFSLVASLLLAGLISLLLYLTPRGLEPASLATILSFLTLFLAAVTYLRWSSLPRSRRFIIGAKRGYRSRRTSGHVFPSLINRRSPLQIALATVLILAGLSLAIYHYHPEMNLFSSPQRYTELEVTWPKSEIDGSSKEQYTTLTAGRELEARARIENHEGSPVNYSLRLVFDNSTIFVKGLRLEDNETWDSMLLFVLGGQPGRQRLDLLLFKEGESTAPYKSESLLVDLIEDHSADLGKVENSTNESTENSSGLPVSFEETTKVTVLSAGSGGGFISETRESAAASPSPAKPAAKETEKQIAKEAAESPPPEGIAVQTASLTAAAASAASSSEAKAQPTAGMISRESPSFKEAEPSPAPASGDAAASGPENGSAAAFAPISASDNLSYSSEPMSSPPAPGSVSSNPAPSAEARINPEPEEAPPTDQLAENDPVSDQLAEEDAIANHPPVLHSLLPDRPSPQIKGTAIIWRAEAIDPDGDRILYRFLLNGTEKRKWSKSSSWSWPTHYLAAGEYTITVQAIDGLHSSSDSYDSSLDATMTILEQNQPPILNELEADPKSPSPLGSLITWTATATDPEGDELSYRFLLDDREVSGWSPSNSWIWNSSGVEAGDHEITVQLRDGYHARQDSFDEEMNSPYTLKESNLDDSSKPAGALAVESSIASLNQIPILAELSSDAISPAETGGIINWTVKATDPDGDRLSYKFLLDGQDVTGWSSSPAWSWNTSGALPGTYKITALARDGNHASVDSFDGSMDAAFTLLDKNQPPVLLSLQPDLSSPRVLGETIIWRAEARDPDNDPILYKFQLEGKDMVRWSESNSWSWSTRGLEAGDYRITVLVRDGRHASEYSFDSSLEESFSLNTVIDQQIDQLMSQRGFKASGNADYRSSDIRLEVADPKA